jgi:hypothetical protein
MGISYDFRLCKMIESSKYWRLSRTWGFHYLKNKDLRLLHCGKCECHQEHGDMTWFVKLNFLKSGSSRVTWMKRIFLLVGPSITMFLGLYMFAIYYAQTCIYIYKVTIIYSHILSYSYWLNSSSATRMDVYANLHLFMYIHGMLVKYG